MIIGLTETVAKTASPDVLLLRTEGLGMAAFPKPHPALGYTVVHFLHGKVMAKRGGERALKGRVLVRHRAASEVDLGGLVPVLYPPGPRATVYLAARHRLRAVAPAAPQVLAFTKF